MALLTFLGAETNKEQQKHHPKQPSKSKRSKHQNQKQPSPWEQIKNLLSCKQINQRSNVIDPSKNNINNNNYSKLGSSCSSICSFKDVVHGNTRVVHRADDNNNNNNNNSPESSSVGQETGLLSRKPVHGSSSARSLANSGRSNYGSSRGMQFRKLSGCYECHMIVDPSRYPMPRTTICACPRCGEVFPKPESLELHQKVRHAVSELGPDDSGRNIVEIIFKSSWLKKDNICKIERILKVHNTQRTMQRFEDCRDAVKARALTSTKKNPRCAADGNELLRFHCTKLSCGLGARGSSGLCGSIPGCGVCTTIRCGFQGKKGEEEGGVCTTASSGRAHDSLVGCTDGRRAMLVCRVIAGRVRRVVDDTAEKPEEELVVPAAAGGGGGGGGGYDSVAGFVGIYSNLEELFVFNPKAILPCFVVIYTALES